jgi:hypothetical protein
VLVAQIVLLAQLQAMERRTIVPDSGWSLWLDMPADRMVAILILGSVVILPVMAIMVSGFRFSTGAVEKGVLAAAACLSLVVGLANYGILRQLARIAALALLKSTSGASSPRRPGPEL